MSGAKKLGDWTGNTDSHIFEVRFFEDEEQGIFIARIEAKQLKVPPSLRKPGQSPSRINMAEEDSLRDENFDVLTARTRAHIMRRYGVIQNLRQKTV